MKRVGLLLALLLGAQAARAAAFTGFSSPTSMSVGDTLCAGTPGGLSGTARFLVDTGASTGVVVTWMQSVDFGYSFVASAYAKQVDAGLANDLVKPTASVSGQYEFEIPANATTSCAFLTASSGAVTITQIAGRPFVGGQPVTAVLYDQTSAVNTALDTGVLETAGWKYMTISGTAPSGGLISAVMVDDTGTSLAQSLGQILSNVTGAVGLGQGVYGTASGSASLPKRTRITSVAVSSLTSRVRVEATR